MIEDKNTREIETADQPLVSVLMTAFNRRLYIGEAIESVLNSTYTNIELIVVDDCSSDNTFELAKRYAEKDDRLHVYRNETNLGDYPNRNRAASYAKGKYIKYLDSDDVIYPHGIAVMVACMEKFPDAGFGLSQNAFGDQLHPIRLDPRESYLRNFLTEDVFGRAPGSSIIKTQAFIDSGGFSGMRQMGDYEYWLSLAQKYPVVTLPKDLVWDRVHGEQEQFLDSAADKEVMWVNVAKSALDSSSCPLSQSEKEMAHRRLDTDLKKTFWKLLIRYGQIKSAMIYRSKLELSWGLLFSLQAK